MKNKILGIALLSLLMPSIVLSEPVYFGLKGGVLTLSDADATIVSTTSSKNIGILAGININEIFSVEAEYTTKVVAGDIDYGIPVVDVTWNVDTLAVYGVFRTPSVLYLKGKLGYLNEDVKIIATSPGGVVEATTSESGLSYGVGVGLYLDETSRVEVEYSTVEADITMLSFTYIF